jgi:hypothetical protein
MQIDRSIRLRMAMVGDALQAGVQSGVLRYGWRVAPKGRTR